jgi:hypothetical protein
MASGSRSRPAVGRQRSSCQGARARGRAGARPRNVNANSSARDGNNSTPPPTTATITLTRVSCDAAARSIVSPGTRTGLRAIAHPAMTVATAIAPDTRAGS